MKVKAILIALVFVLVVQSIFADSTEIIKQKLDELAELQEYRKYEKIIEETLLENVEAKLSDLYRYVKGVNLLHQGEYKESLHYLSESEITQIILDDLNEETSKETLIGLSPFGDFTRVVYRTHFIDADTAAIFGSIITKLTREDDGYWVRPTSNGKFELIFDSFLNYRFAVAQQENIKAVLSN